VDGLLDGAVDAPLVIVVVVEILVASFAAASTYACAAADALAVIDGDNGPFVVALDDRLLITNVDAVPEEHQNQMSPCTETTVSAVSVQLTLTTNPW
jgi:hypothetical protein